MSVISVDNKSSCVSDADVKLMVQACNILLPKVAKAWAVTCPAVVFATKSPADWVFHIIDADPNTPDALAYHTEEKDHVDGYVLAKTIIDNGGVSLYKDQSTSTVASALFHEIVEALLDDSVNAYWYNNNDNLLYSAEIADPCQDNNVIVTVKNSAGHPVKVALSDFILPAWKDNEATKGPFNYTNTLTAPFSIDKGGYVVTLDPTTNQTNQVFGERVPQWVKDWKSKSHRINKRRKTHEKGKHRKVEK